MPATLAVDSLEFVDLPKLRAYLTREGWTHARSCKRPVPLAEWAPYPHDATPRRYTVYGGTIQEMPYDPFGTRDPRFLGRWPLYKHPTARNPAGSGKRYWLG